MRAATLKRVLRALVIAPLLTGTLYARPVHEPQEPLNLMPALRHVMIGSAATGPAGSAQSPVLDSGPSTRRSLSAVSPLGRSSSSGRGESSWRDGAFVRRSEGLDLEPAAQSGIQRDMSSGLLRLSGSDMIELGGDGWSTSSNSQCPGVAVPLLDRLTPERVQKVMRTFARRPTPKKPRTAEGRAAPKPRSRSPLAPHGPTNDPANQRDDAGALPGSQELDGAGHMEMHWTADAVGLSTFVGGSQSAEAEHSTAFGRDIGAEVGLQYLDSSSRAYRIMVARSFKNDLDAPVQSAKFQFEVNVRF